MEMGVAASKTFTSQVVPFLVALKLAEVEDIAARGDRASARRGALPDFHRGLSRRRPSDRGDHAGALREASLYLGRHRAAGLPRRCAEAQGDLYIPTEAYSAGEKHGRSRSSTSRPRPFARDRLARLRQGRVQHPGSAARGAQVIAIATDGNEDVQHHADDVIFVPRTHPFLQAALAVVPCSSSPTGSRGCAAWNAGSAAEPGQDGHGRVAAFAPVARLGSARSRRRRTRCRFTWTCTASRAASR